MSLDKLVLVVNAGSSSLKYAIFKYAAQKLTASVNGMIERIGELDQSRLIMNFLEEPQGEKLVQQISIQDEEDESVPAVLSRPEPSPHHLTLISLSDAGKSAFSLFDAGPGICVHMAQDHTAALDNVLKQLHQNYSRDIGRQMEAVGHRVVHGKNISTAQLVDDSVIAAIKDAASMAPLHNPANLQGIMAASAVFDCPQVAVFDTAFHQTMAPAAYTYALPVKLAKREGLRRYGAHGTSYRYLVGATSKLLQRPASELNLIIGHIDTRNGQLLLKSLPANRRSWRQHGMHPGRLMMGTRCGDVDPAVVLYLAQHCGMAAADIDKLLNKQSGFLGLAGNSDLRSVIAASAAGDAQSQVAIEVFIQRLRKYLGAYLIELEGSTNAIVFSAGIGENNAMTRKLCLKGLEPFGIVVDEAKNQEAAGGVTAEIQADASAIKILVIPTDEELSIAEQTVETVRNLAHQSEA